MSAIPMATRFNTSEVDALIRPFVNLLDATKYLCETNETFRIKDLYTFYFQRISGRQNDRGALADIAQSYVKELGQSVKAENMTNLCVFFLQNAPRSIVDQSIRSMFRCLKINPFTVEGPYARFLTNVKGSRTKYDERAASLFRTSSIIRLLNDSTLSPNHLNDLIRITNETQDKQLNLVFAQHLVRHISVDTSSMFNRNAPSIWNTSLVKDILASLHRSEEYYIRPYSQWDQPYTQRAMKVRDLVDRFGVNTFSNKTLILDLAYFYPDEDYWAHISSTLRSDPDVQRVLQRRNNILNE